MMYRACFPMHYSACSDGDPTKCFSNGLMAETYAQDRNPFRKIPDDFNRDAGIRRCTGTRGNEQSFRVQGFQFFYCNFIISKNLDIGLATCLLVTSGNGLDYIIGKRIVIIYYSNHLIRAPSPPTQPPFSDPLIY